MMSNAESETIEVTWDAFLKAVEDELISHFQWTSVQGLVELEARQIAWSAFQRLRGDGNRTPKRPKDMTPEELDALPECDPGGMRFEETLDPDTGLTRRTPILERGSCFVKRMDDLALFQGSDGLVYTLLEQAAGWHKVRFPI